MRGFSGRVRNEAVFAAAFAIMRDVRQAEKNWYARRAYLARYLRQPFSELDGLVLTESQKLIEAVSEIVRREGVTGKESE